MLPTAMLNLKLATASSMDTSDRKAMDLFHWAAMHPDSVVGTVRSQPCLEFTEDSRDMEAIEKLRDIQNPNVKVWYEPGVDAW
jgi:hypothetical protein